MKTRVRPLHEARYKDWLVEVFDPCADTWIENSEHKFFWQANWKAHRLAKYSLDVKMNKKEEFVRKLKEGEDEA